MAGDLDGICQLIVVALNDLLEADGPRPHQAGHQNGVQGMGEAADCDPAQGDAWQGMGIAFVQLQAKPLNDCITRSAKIVGVLQSI